MWILKIRLLRMIFDSFLCILWYFLFQYRASMQRIKLHILAINNMKRNNLNQMYKEITYLQRYFFLILQSLTKERNKNTRDISPEGKHRTWMLTTGNSRRIAPAPIFCHRFFCYFIRIQICFTSNKGYPPIRIAGKICNTLGHPIFYPSHCIQKTSIARL